MTLKLKDLLKAGTANGRVVWQSTSAGYVTKIDRFTITNDSDTVTICNESGKEIRSKEQIPGLTETIEGQHDAACDSEEDALISILEERYCVEAVAVKEI